MDREINDDEEIFNFELPASRPNNTDEDGETTGGVGNQSRGGVGSRLAAASLSRKTSSEDETSGGLETMGISALLASYAAYAAAHGMLAEQRAHDASILTQLRAIRNVIQKRCMEAATDVILPLLAHINPYVHITAAVDLLFSAFKTKDRAVEVLSLARGGGRGFLPFLAGYALDTYFHAQLPPLSTKVLSEAARLYTQLPRSIKEFNGKAESDLPLPKKTLARDGNPHTGRFISLASNESSERYYAQHVGMNEYHVYRADQLSEIPKDGERYHVSRTGQIRRIAEQTRAGTRGKA